MSTNYTNSGLSTMRNDDLKELAKTEFGIDFHEDATKNTMVNGILGAQESAAQVTRADVTQTQQAPEPSQIKKESGAVVDLSNFQPPEENIATAGLDRGEERIWVTVAKDHGPGGGDPIPIGCNGNVCVVHRDVKVPLKRKFLEILEHTMQTTYSWDEVLQENVGVDVPRFNFTTHGPVLDREAVAA